MTAPVAPVIWLEMLSLFPVSVTVSVLEPRLTAPVLMVRVPESVIAMGPALVTVTPPERLKLVPLRLTPPAPVVAIKPVIVVVPLPAVCVRLVALMELAFTFSALIRFN